MRHLTSNCHESHRLRSFADISAKLHERVKLGLRSCGKHNKCPKKSSRSLLPGLVMSWAFVFPLRVVPKNPAEGFGQRSLDDAQSYPQEV